jgi:hypothetical protein
MHAFDTYAHSKTTNFRQFLRSSRNTSRNSTKEVVNKEIAIPLREMVICVQNTTKLHIAQGVQGEKQKKTEQGGPRNVERSRR